MQVHVHRWRLPFPTWGWQAKDHIWHHISDTGSAPYTKACAIEGYCPEKEAPVKSNFWQLLRYLFVWGVGSGPVSRGEILVCGERLASNWFSFLPAAFFNKSSQLIIYQQVVALRGGAPVGLTITGNPYFTKGHASIFPSKWIGSLCGNATA